MKTRFLNRRVGAMLLRNTVSSSLSFLASIGVLWLLVTYADMDEVLAAAIGFVAAQSVHYALARGWIFPESDRAVGTGYVIFLANAGLGMAITVSLYALLLDWTGMNYLLARLLVSVVAGLAMFLSNATLNFRKV
ncbi:putative flippase GtrA [Sphingobium sp. OAS761]|uniref:GtrA family protein n=1 Tax=Sphingobium sp. OAS761 TaxID=2817901 RepID=UPI00209E192B|nr:GtrA family protein [Sphingobium sp. OAS761]MCP1469422.1 putative flippase GtrA [Sphingobium sp. OAS761]